MHFLPHEIIIILCTFCVFFLEVSHVHSEIISYKHQLLRPSIPEYSAIPKYIKGNVPSHSPGNGRSYIDISRIEFKNDCNNVGDDTNDNELICKNATVSVIIFEAPIYKPWLSHWKNYQLCCTEEGVRDGDCLSSQIGRIIIPNDVADLYSEDFLVLPNEKASIGGSIIGHQVIKTSGIYVLAMMTCNSDASSSVTVNGVVESLDPYGYLPADIFGNLPFYLCLNFLYLILGLTWCYYCVKNDCIMERIHYWITIVLICGLLEVTFLYLNYFHWNDSGYQALDIASIGLFFGVLKRSFSRAVVLLVSLGYDIVKSSIGDDMQKVLKLALAYFVMSTIYTFGTNLLSNVRSVGESSDDLFQLVLFILLCIDTGFYIWIFYSINSLLESLYTKKQYFKYLMYKNFRIVLFLSVIFTSVAGICGSILFLNSSKGADGTWQYRWTVDAIWDLAYFFVFAVMASLWTPSKLSEFKYKKTDDDDDDNDIELPSVPVAFGSVHSGGRGGDDSDLSNGLNEASNDESKFLLARSRDD